MAKKLKLETRRDMSRELAKKYQRASKTVKTEILNHFVELTGYHRTYASYLLKNWGRKVVLRGKDGREVVFVGEVSKKRNRGRKKPSIYGEDVVRPLKRIWQILGFLCGKRLAPYMQEIVEVSERCGENEVPPPWGEIELSDEVRSKLLEISASTIDRKLSGERKKWTLKGRATTKPGSLLKSKIQVRTFADWNEKKPGFVEVDLVGHDGGDPRGDFCQTLDVTDIHTAWTETQAVKNKAQVWVFAALKDIMGRIPFPVLGIDSDNGGEFINHHLERFCEKHKITFTKSRPYRKNDSCYVEQKNWSVVRKAVGYQRYDTEEELTLLNELYGYLRLYTNYFQPTMKQTEKIREGAKVKKRYDIAKTPYKRVLGCAFVRGEVKEELKKEYEGLNPAELKRSITRLQNKLLKVVKLKAQRTEGLETQRQVKKENEEVENVISFV